MPIADFLGGDAFDPHTVGEMNLAFRAACAVLGLTDTSDRATEVVARRIIAFAKAGERDAERMKAAALDSFRAP